MDGIRRYEQYSSQFDDGLVQVKNFVNFFSTLLTQHPQPDIAKLTGCLELLKKDQEGKSLEGASMYETTASIMFNTMKSYKLFLDQIDAKLHKPFSLWLKDCLKAKERMDKDFKNAQKKLVELVKALKKQEQECLKALESVKKSRTDFKLVESTRKKFSTYESMVEQGLELQKQLYTEIMPKNYKEMESLEASQQNLNSTTLPELKQAYNSTNAFMKQSAEMLMMCMGGEGSVESEPWDESYEPIEYLLPCRDPDIVTGNFESEIQKKVFMGKVEQRRAQAEKTPETPMSSEKRGSFGTPVTIHAFPEREIDGDVPTDSSRRKPTVTAEDLAKMERTRDQVTKEIVETEQTYVQCLQAAVSCFLRPLESPESSNILSKEQLNSLFSNIGTLADLNRKFCSDLEKRRNEEWKTKDQMGDLFLKFTPYFKMYTTYINNHPTANALLATLIKDNSKFNAFLKTHPEHNLAALLIAPVQRVPRYRLLLEVLLKNTPPDHPDFPELTKALESVKEVAVGLNEKAKVIESFNELRDIEASFVGGIPSLITPSRKFVRRGPLIKKCRAKDEEYEFFLFNDLLIYASRVPMSKMFNLHRMIEINSAFKVDHNVDSPTEFTIISPAKIFKVIGVNEEDKAQWLRALTNCMAGQMLIETGARGRRPTLVKEPEETNTSKFRTLRNMTLPRKKEGEAATPAAPAASVAPLKAPVEKEPGQGSVATLVKHFKFGSSSSSSSSS